MRLIHHNQRLSTNGDGTGTIDFIGDYSSVPVIGFIKAPTGKVFRVGRMIVYIEDATGMRAERYGSLADELTNGITMTVHTKEVGGQVTDFTKDDPIKRNAQWGSLCYDVAVKSWGPGNDILLARYSFFKYDFPIELHEEDHIDLRFSDDFTGIVHHQFQFEGLLI